MIGSGHRGLSIVALRVADEIDFSAETVTNLYDNIQ